MIIILIKRAHAKLIIVYYLLLLLLIIIIIINNNFTRAYSYNESEMLYGKHELTQLLKVHNRLPIRPEGYMCLRCNASI